MFAFFGFIAGLLFGLGLILSGMANPGKVLGFLDLAGRWDPSLALVMAGAIAVSAPAFALAKRRTSTFLDMPLPPSPSRKINVRLVLGSLVFGVGWGLAGFCPGPALVVLGTGNPKAVAFVAAMIVGMGLFELLEKSRVLAAEV